MPGGNSALSFSVVFQLARGNQFPYFLGDGFARARDFMQPVFRHQLLHFHGQVFDGAHHFLISPNLEGVFALQFEEVGNVLEDLGKVAILHPLLFAPLSSPSQGRRH